MSKTIRALPCHFRPFETGRSLICEHPTLRYGWQVRRYLYKLFAAGADQSNYDHVKEKFDHHFNDNNKNVLAYYSSKNLDTFTKILYTYCNFQRHQKNLVTSLQHHVIHDKLAFIYKDSTNNAG